MKELIKQIKKARFVFVCGNGGSSATAEHLVSDLFSKGIKAICLNSNTAIMTMLANDYEYKYVFGKQLELFGSSEDLLITISASGTSENILDAHKVAKLMEINTYQFEVTENKDNIDYEGLEDRHMETVHQIKKLL